MIFQRQPHLEQHHPQSRTKPLSLSSSHAWYPISSTPSTDMWELPSSHTLFSGGSSSSSPTASMDANDDGHDAAGAFSSPRFSFLYSESWNGGDGSNSSFASASAATAARTRSSGVSARTPTNGEFDGDAADNHGGVSIASRDDQETTRYFASDASTREILGDATNTVPMRRNGSNNITAFPSRRIRRSQFY